MKVAPVIAALAARSPETEVILVHTGQHYDAVMSDVFLSELGLEEPHVFLGAAVRVPRRRARARAFRVRR
jgi:UDP-N-acetylglucosamine 2-epimerase (non-hydrolysing)